MRIKSDFVTNSSSTAFVVFVPDSFYPSDQDVEDALAKVKNDYDGEPPPDMIVDKEIHECLELLKEGDNIYTYYEEGVHQSIYYALLEILTQHGFVVNSIEIPSEGNEAIYGISEQAIEKIMINNIDLLSMFNSLQRSEKHVTEKT